MQKILWLDDESLSISFERDILIPDEIDIIDLKIITFETISELMEYISCNEINSNDIFIIDIMLIEEEEIVFEDREVIPIPNDLMAGATLYIEFLSDLFSDNYIILYTSREHSGNVFQHIINDEHYEETLFLIDKWKRDTEFISVLKKILGVNNE
jgi:hypothetical protein